MKNKFLWKILKKSSPLKKYSPLYKYTFIHILHISSQCVTRLVQTIVQPTAITHSHIQKKELTHDPFLFATLTLWNIGKRQKEFGLSQTSLGRKSDLYRLEDISVWILPIEFQWILVRSKIWNDWAKYHFRSSNISIK